MSAVLLELPMAPSMNTYWRRGPNRSPRAPTGAMVTHLTKEGREFRRQVRLTWLAQPIRRSLAGSLSVRAWIWFARPGSDVDNRIKPTLDALAHAGVFENDNQVAYVAFRRMTERRRPATMIVHVEPDGADPMSFSEIWESLRLLRQVPEPRR